jgi:hypothetical protein
MFDQNRSIASSPCLRMQVKDWQAVEVVLIKSRIRSSRQQLLCVQDFAPITN